MPLPVNAESFTIGLEINPHTGKVKPFCTGSLDASRAEEIAGQLLALAQAVRDESRSFFKPAP